MKRLGVVLAGLTLAALLVLAAGCNSGKESAASPQPGGAAAPAIAVQPAGSNQQVGLWVTGQGKVTAVPDLALLSLGVEARAETRKRGHVPRD